MNILLACQQSMCVFLLLSVLLSGCGNEIAQTGEPSVSETEELAVEQQGLSEEQLKATERKEEALTLKQEAEGNAQEGTEEKEEATAEEARLEAEKLVAEAKKKEAEKKKARKKRGALEFEEMVHNFGSIQQGDKVEHKFRFKNTGKAPVVIREATASCGCTHPSYPFIPIEPGEEGFIGVMYNSTGKLGNQKPSITVKTNAKPRTYQLYLKGIVDAPRAPKETESTDSQGG